MTGQQSETNHLLGEVSYCLWSIYFTYECASFIMKLKIILQIEVQWCLQQKNGSFSSTCEQDITYSRIDNKNGSSGAMDVLLSKRPFPAVPTQVRWSGGGYWRWFLFLPPWPPSHRGGVHPGLSRPLGLDLLHSKTPSTRGRNEESHKVKELYRCGRRERGEGEDRK
jgi:hypothetical protein